MEGKQPRTSAECAKTAHLDGFGRVEGGADLIDVSAMGANALVELVAGDAELLGPVGDVGGHLGVDLFGVVRAFDVIFVASMRLVGCGDVVVLGHGMFPLFDSLRWMMKVREGMYVFRGTHSRATAQSMGIQQPGHACTANRAQARAPNYMHAHAG